MVEQTSRAMTSSPVVCLIGETEALQFTPHNQSFPHSYTSQSFLSTPTSVIALTPTHLSESFITPTHHNESFHLLHIPNESLPHSYTSRDLPSLLHITVSPSHTPTHHSESFPHSYTSQRDLPSLLHITVSPSHTPTHHSEPFSHSYASQ
ncbi:hypothetical protein Hamer_G005848 [Homarus americanus]|uniref:Uncharacterized protein n=1 Tax=Homarus americanus TaxID=6706 RepID=A0A8J5JMX3_HOMAM|nr:hypothetical protein Hamer_G005848 [Homarus americanus]